MNKKAVLDIGSLKVKISIFDKTNKQRLSSDSHLTLLGKGIDKQGTINKESIELLNIALRDIASHLHENNIDDISIIGTEALRKAENIEIVHQLIKKYFPKHQLEVIDQHREAELFFSAVSKTFPDKEIAAIDIGGGSIQIIIGKFDSKTNNIEIKHKYNLNTGTYKLQQKYSPDNHVISKDLKKARNEIEKTFKVVDISAPTLIFGSTCMLDFILSSKIKTSESNNVYHPILVDNKILNEFLQELLKLPPDQRDHFYPDGGYFMYGADYLLMNLLAAINRLNSKEIYPTNINSSYAFI